MVVSLQDYIVENSLMLKFNSNSVDILLAKDCLIKVYILSSQNHTLTHSFVNVFFISCQAPDLLHTEPQGVTILTGCAYLPFFKRIFKYLSHRYLIIFTGAFKYRPWYDDGITQI